MLFRHGSAQKGQQIQNHLYRRKLQIHSRSTLEDRLFSQLARHHRQEFGRLQAAMRGHLKIIMGHTFVPLKGFDVNVSQH